jgi:soluble cytochrome b562
MSEDDVERAKAFGSGAKQGRTGPYTAKDFQFEVLGQLAEVQTLTEALKDSLADGFEKGQEHSNLLRFDGRTLVAVGAIALSLTGYVLQDARNTSKREGEIEAMKSRVMRLEQDETTNTEGRIRAEVELRELREGQAETKSLMQARDSAHKRAIAGSATAGTESTREHGRE